MQKRTKGKAAVGGLAVGVLSLFGPGFTGSAHAAEPCDDYAPLPGHIETTPIGDVCVPG